MKIIKYDAKIIHYPIMNRMDLVFAAAEKIADIIRSSFKDDSPIGLVCRGSSGVCIATAIAQRYANCRVLYIRKDGESEHNTDRIIEDRGIQVDHWTLIFVDDLISSGKTLLACMESIKDEYNGNVRIKAVALLYQFTFYDPAITDRANEMNLQLPSTIICRE